MVICAICEAPFELTVSNRRYCSPRCAKRANNLAFRSAHPVPPTPDREARCANCQAPFTTNRGRKIFCSHRCAQRVGWLVHAGRVMVVKAEAGTLRPERSLYHRDPYTPAEIAALRADPMCVLPNRTLTAQWKKCHKLGIRRDRSLYVAPYRSPESVAYHRTLKTPPAKQRRQYFRRRIRENPEPTIAELRKLARGHQHAEDLVLEGFATVLRLAIPAPEAFKLAKAEVNRTSAQPFREQSFNPDIDYEARETGRQVSRASDLRAARGEG